MWQNTSSLALAETDLQREGLIGSIEKLVLFFMPEEGKSRIVQKSIYNRQGNLTSRIVYEKGTGFNSRTSFQYNQENRKIKESIFDHSKNLISKIIWKYDSSGHLINRVRYDNKEQIILKKVWLYDVSGRILKKKLIYPKRPEKNQSILYKFNNNGQLLSERQFSHNNIPLKKQIFIYRKTGKISREATYKMGHYNQKLTETILKNLAYNKSAELIEKTLFLPDGKFWRRWTYKYNHQGKKTEEILYLKPGKIESKWIYLYDSKNSLLQAHFEKNKPYENLSVLRPISIERWKYKEERDKRGNWIRKTVRKRINSETKFKSIGVYTRKLEYFKIKNSIYP